MEELIHYAWKHKMFPLSALKTHQGQALEVIDVGLHNRHAGPDFFNAKVKIDGVLWVGNVELHVKSIGMPMGTIKMHIMTMLFCMFAK